MIKTLAAAAVLSLGLAGYAMAQDTPAAAPAAPMAEPMHHHLIIIITIIIITITITCTTWPQKPLRLRQPRRNKQRLSADFRVRAKPPALQTNHCLESFFFVVFPATSSF